MSDPRVLKPYAAHGWVVMRTTYTRGGIFTYVITDPINFPLHLYTKGRIDVYDIDTNELRSERSPGFWNGANEDFSKPRWKLVVEEGSEVWCFDPTSNKGVRPPATNFYIRENEQRSMLSTDKFFLCAGKILVNDNLIEGPKQIRFQTNCTVLALTDCHGVLIE